MTTIFSFIIGCLVGLIIPALWNRYFKLSKKSWSEIIPEFDYWEINDLVMLKQSAGYFNNYLFVGYNEFELLFIFQYESLKLSKRKIQSAIRRNALKNPTAEEKAFKNNPFFKGYEETKKIVREMNI